VRPSHGFGGGIRHSKGHRNQPDSRRLRRDFMLDREPGRRCLRTLATRGQ